MTTYADDIRRAATDANIPWAELSGKNILVTGATGLIGSCLVEVLLSHPGIDYEVYASGRNKDRFFRRFAPRPHLHFIQHDVTKPLVADVDFHFIVAAASGATPNVYATDPVGVMKANFLGVDGLLSYGARHQMQKFVYVSSGEVYGEGDGRAFTEDYSGYVDCTKPRSCYPSSKRAAETLCAAYAAQYGVSVCMARPSHIYGPFFTEADNRVYAQFIRNVLRDEDIVMKSTGSQFRSWCYVVDCAAALLYILLKGQSGEAYNVADEGSNISIKQLAEMIAGIAGRRVVIDAPSATEAAGFNRVTKSVFSTEKLEGLGWKISGTMQEKMERTIAALR